MTTVTLDAIAFDAGTQVRAAIDQQVVSDYAEAMTNGATFPPIVLFHDGNQHYLADGFHRYMAAQRNQWREIDADVRPGTKEDALWFALGANRANGQRMNQRDVRHAIEMALLAWPDRSGKQLAEQIGCSQRYVATVRSQVSATANLPDRVIGRDGKSHPAFRQKEQPAVHPQRATVVEMVRAGKTSRAICDELKVRCEFVAAVRRELGVARADTSRAAVRGRRERMHEMASSGYTSRQIAAELHLSEQVCKKALREAGVVVAADQVTRGLHRHDSNRILERIVMDAENLTEGANLIDFADVDRARLGDWIDSLIASRRTLDQFIKRLTKEKTRDGEAA